MIVAYRELLMQAVYERRTLGSFWVVWTILALVVGTPLGIGVWLQDWRPGLFFGAVLLGLIWQLWWGNMVRLAVLQNFPSHACLVPNLRRRLMRMVSVTFLVGVVLVSALAAPMIGHFGYLLCALSLMFPFVLLQQRYHVLGIVPSVVIFSALSWAREPWQALVRLVSNYDESVVSALLLCVIVELSVLALRAALPRGGDAHAEWRANYLQRQLRMKGNLRGAVGEGSAAQRWPRWVAFWRDLGIGGARDASGMTQRGLGMSFYAVAVSVPGMAIVGWACVALPAMLSDELTLGLSLWRYMVELMVTIAIPTAVQRLVVTISMRAGEQSLLRLAPAMPVASDINRMLARLLVKSFTLLWVSAALCEVLAARFSVGYWVLDGSLLLVLVLPLPFFAAALRDYAATPPRALALNGISLLSLPALGLAWLLALQAPALCGWVALALMVVSALLLRQRWQRMLAAPVAFPAGRLA